MAPYYFLGIDVGTVSVKFALVDNVGSTSSALSGSSEGFFVPHSRLSLTKGFDSCVLLSRYQRTKGSPVEATFSILKSLLSLVPAERIAGIRVTGSGGKRMSALLGVPYENEFKALAMGVALLHPEVKTVFEMGGDTSKYLRLEVQNGEVEIVDYEKNGDCAAGTGSFIDQQAARLKYAIEEVGPVVLRADKAATVAGRCSVFAKTDMIHAQQKGFQPPAVLKGLCQAVVRNFRSSITKGKEIVPRVAFIGGVAANEGVVQAMKEIFRFSDEAFFVPECYAWMGAIGAAVLGAKSGRAAQMMKRSEPVSEVLQRLSELETSQAEGQNFPTMEPLSKERVVFLRDHVRPYSFEGKTLPVDGYLGIDVGSVSTNLVVIDDEGNIVTEIYVMTEGRPIEVVQRSLKQIQQELGPRVVIRGVGTTGSGRELLGELVGADTINDEITAHTTGAMYISKKLIHRQVDTIFEIGGQDSKFISLQDGIVVDFAMNEACAAGTGSFLEEQAEKLGINIKGEFAELAFRSKTPLRLGERCTVFMEKEIVPYLNKGARKEDLVAGLAYSIVHNYLNRVVRGRKIGDVIYFQGGTAYNDAVASAFATVLNKEIIVPPHNGVVGAIGMALLAREKVKASGKATTFRGLEIEKVDYRIRSFTCKACPNYCEMQEFVVEGEKTFWGDKCSDKFRKKRKVDQKPVLPDLIAQRARLLEKLHQPPRDNGPVVGIPRALFFHERFPFWVTYFQALGMGVVLSDPTNTAIINAGVEASVAEPCFPVRVAHGHVQNLINKGVDLIFLPNVVDYESKFPETSSFLCPWNQTLPFVVKQSPAFANWKGHFLVPTVHFRLGEKTVARELAPMVRKLGASVDRSRQACREAYAAQRAFQETLVRMGKEALDAICSKGEMAIVLVGRGYNLYDSAVNLDVPRKLRDYYGINVIPMDFLDLDTVSIREINDNMFWNSGRRILQAAKIVGQYPNLHIIYLTNFKCGPDSFIKHYIVDASKKPYLTLQFDGHANDAGVMTRCEAYLDSKGFLRRWKKPEEVSR